MTTPTKLQRWLDLITFRVSRRLPVAVDRIMAGVPAYAEKWRTGDDTDRASARRMFERDKDELRELGIPLETVSYSINYGMEQTEGYRVARRDFYLPYLRLASEVEAEQVAAAEASGRPDAALSPSELGRAQHAVWEEIHDISRSLDATSSTGDLGETYRKWTGRLGEMTEAFPRVEGQVGLLVFVRERPLGLDLIGAPGLYAKLHERLLRGYLLDMIRHRRVDRSKAETAGQDAADYGDALGFLARVAEATLTGVPTPGRGVYRVLSETVVGGELDDRELAEERGWPDGLVHLSAFAAGETDPAT